MNFPFTFTNAHSEYAILNVIFSVAVFRRTPLIGLEGQRKSTKERSHDHTVNEILTAHLPSAISGSVRAVDDSDVTVEWASKQCQSCVVVDKARYLRYSRGVC